MEGRAQPCLPGDSEYLPGMIASPDPGGLSLPVLLASFLDHLHLERGLSGNTTVAYRADCERFIAGLPPNLVTAPGQITEKDVFEFLVAERKRGRDVTSVRRSLSALRTFFRFLARERVVERNPARGLENPRTWKRMPSVLQVDEMRRLLEAVRAHPSRYPLRDAAMLELAYATGLRVGELTSLKLGSLRPDLRILRCIGKGSKERIVPVSRRSLDAVDRYVTEERPRLARFRPTDLLFVSRGGKPIGREVVSAMLRKYALLAGLPGRITPHVLRHSFATHMIQRGADLRIVQEILGHANVETTEIYTHLNKTDLKAAHRKYHPRG
jgi:integrase/recombinase XerD